VARSLVELLARKATELPFDCRITGVITRRGRLERAAGLERAELESGVLTGGPQSEADILNFIQNCPADVVIEISTLNPHTGQPAADHIRAGLQAGRHVITANKGPVAHAALYRELCELAGQQKRQFRFEGAVMDGAPIFNLVEHTLPYSKVTGFRGILNGTTNFILERMSAGHSFAEALLEARAMGVAEADPQHDLMGWDGAAKVAALANVLLAADMNPLKVRREVAPIEELPERVAQARQHGRVLKQIAEAEITPAGVESRVALVELEPGDFLANSFESGGALTLFTDTMGRLSIVEHDGHTDQTAFALLADLSAIVPQLIAPH
jgi:homoserine dehydrogenase